MTPEARELAEAEAKVAFVRAVDEQQGVGLSGPQLWRAIFVEGYLRGLDPRTHEEVELEMAVMVAADSGLTTPARKDQPCARPTN
jgi:hypothetical protein